MDFRKMATEILSRYQQARYRDRSGPFERFQAREKNQGLPVLINILPAVFGLTPEQKQALAEFARTALRLDHPHVVQTLEVAQQAGVPYIVTPLLQGARSLASMLTDKPLDIERAGALLAQIGAALEYAGQRGLPHGNLTPDHVLVDERGEVSVAGFGLAALATLAGVASADPSNPYLAPEQRFAGHGPGTRGDVYALAAIFYRLITGRPPDPDPKRFIPPEKLNPAIRPAIGEVLRRALSPQPQQRFQSADDFILALRSVIRSPHAAPAASESGGEAGPTATAETQMPPPLPFPEPLVMPQPDLSALDGAAQWTKSMLESAAQAIVMPEPLPMPVLEGAEAAPGAPPAPAAPKVKKKRA